MAVTAQWIFDVFLAYNHADLFAARKIATELRSRGLLPWIDEEEVRPGQHFQDVIQKTIPSVRAAAVLIGESGIGRWQKLELRSFISQCVERDIPVIPVLLPGAELPFELLFLRELNCVEFTRSKITGDTPAFDKLEWGITGKRPSVNRGQRQRRSAK